MKFSFTDCAYVKKLLVITAILRYVFWCCLYTHTVPINYSGRDCVRGVGLNRAHIAARSYHMGGVNAAFVDGSVHFIPDTIDLSVWKTLGTRAAGDVVEANAF